MHAVERGAAVRQSGQIVARGQRTDALERVGEFGALLLETTVL
ncbi:MAG TPA: hypothetical protein VNU48_04145 [Burkholderiaceae bacterium]|nr:hypothetical protein [Burkholderiaceae bacterium]